MHLILPPPLLLSLEKRVWAAAFYFVIDHKSQTTLHTKSAFELKNIIKTPGVQFKPDLFTCLSPAGKINSRVYNNKSLLKRWPHSVLQLPSFTTEFCYFYDRSWYYRQSCTYQNHFFSFNMWRRWMFVTIRPCFSGPCTQFYSSPIFDVVKYILHMYTRLLWRSVLNTL